MSPTETSDFLFESSNCPTVDVDQKVEETKTRPKRLVRTGKNQLGGNYLNGRPLALSIREQIVEMYNRGVKPCR
jgi:hypothetical protein